MQNWKTTLTGALAGVGYIIYKLASHQPLTVQDFILAAGLVTGGALAKDASTHSTVAETQQATADDNAKIMRNVG